jgi:hypothetical protein
MDGISSIFSVASEGLNNATRQFTNTAQQIADDSINSPGPSVSDLAQQSVDLINDKTAFIANSLVIKTADHLLGTLLDVLDIDARQQS